MPESILYMCAYGKMRNDEISMLIPHEWVKLWVYFHANNCVMPQIQPDTPTDLPSLGNLTMTISFTKYRALHARMSHRMGASKACLYISDHRK